MACWFRLISLGSVFADLLFVILLLIMLCFVDCLLDLLLYLLVVCVLLDGFAFTVFILVVF